MENLRSKKALSPVAAVIILIAVTVAVSIAVAAWMGVITFPKEDLGVRVNARIYSANHNIGVLNEDGIFDIFIENYVNSRKTINIVVDADEHVLFNETVVIEAVSSKNLTINRKLIFLGLWTIKFYEDKEIVGGYSFITVVNKAEADMKITQLDNITLNTNLSIVAIIISILSVIVSIVHVMYARKARANSD